MAPLDHLSFLKDIHWGGVYVPGDTFGVSAATVRTFSQAVPSCYFDMSEYEVDIQCFASSGMMFEMQVWQHFMRCKAKIVKRLTHLSVWYTD